MSKTLDELKAKQARYLNWLEQQDDALRKLRSTFADDQRIIENIISEYKLELADLDRAIAALEAPAPPLDELRSVPGAEEQSRDHIDLDTDEVDLQFKVRINAQLARALEADFARSALGAEDESGDQSEGVRRFTEEVIRSETRDPGEVPAPEDAAEDFTLLDPAVLNIDEAILDATILPQVTPDEVPPTAEVIHTDDGRKRFALFGGQTHEVVSGSGNPDADFWANVLHPKPKVDA